MNARMETGREERLLELSHKMELAARRSDWDEVQKLLDARGALLQAPLTDDEFVISSIVRTDKLVTELASAEREQVRQQLEKISNGRKAVSAYRDSES